MAAELNIGRKTYDPLLGSFRKIWGRGDAVERVPTSSVGTFHVVSNAATIGLKTYVQLNSGVF